MLTPFCLDDVAWLVLTRFRFRWFRQFYHFFLIKKKLTQPFRSPHSQFTNQHNIESQFANLHLSLNPDLHPLSLSPKSTQIWIYHHHLLSSSSIIFFFVFLLWSIERGRWEMTVLLGSSSCQWCCSNPWSKKKKNWRRDGRRKRRRKRRGDQRRRRRILPDGSEEEEGFRDLGI